MEPAPGPVERVAAACAAALPAAGPVVAGVSGGSDSVALLGAAAEVLGPRLVVATVDHGLRASAAAEQRLVADLCRDLGLTHRLLAAPPGAGDRRGATETASRARRHGALAGLVTELGAVGLLLAHHRDDAHESLLLHLARGHRGDRALASIPALRPLAGGALLLRPFLVGPRPPGRVDLTRWREARGLPALDDPTNADASVPRNGLRAWRADPDAPEVVGAARLEATRRRAQRRLAATLAAAAERLARHLHPAGAGARLDAAALTPPDGRPADGWLVELLRLLGGCLAAPRELDMRASWLREWRRRGGPSARGALELPGRPRPLVALLAADGLHLPHEPLAPGPPEARVLGALLRLPAHLPDGAARGPARDLAGAGAP